MKIQPTTLAQIANLLKSEFSGNPDLPVTGINEIHVVIPGDIVFVDHPKYYDKALNSKATIVLINQKVDCPEGKGLIFSEDPFKDFNFLINFFNPFEFNKELVASSAEIGKNCQIHTSVTIGNNVKIGNNCMLFPGVVIHDNCIIEDNVIIQSNSVIGGMAFYYKNRGTHRERLNSGGRVIIKEYVEIGVCSTIDKGVTGDTIIGKHTKIDNHVQVGHDTVIGEMCVIASQVGIAGCSVIGNNVTLWGQVGIPSDITIGDNVVVMAQSGVTKSLEANKSYFGSPAEESRKKMKELASIRQIPSILNKMKGE
ncbi:MAG: UDP-3-O-(3-hydroxymyristoyl)glucosamine N-acyltransferase [Flavobacteriales bacterium]|nr:UDP-3-O-(3-hydroxymyristoyl)glucosamine N-acyltransferase [Flavobacteriales bacterium]MCB9335194.1 UDP-3-O-(3-hydroxymyristoyl)glucosamine N-acyltransferase [Flavobacteriales bacterium]